MIDKVVSSLDEALEGLAPGMKLSVGGFGTCGTPFVLIDGIVERGVGDLEVYSNNPGTQIDETAMGLSKVVEAGLMRKFCGSFVGFAKALERQYLTGEIDVDLIPQGTLAERMRAGGAGIPAFFTPTGAGSMVSEGGLPIRYDANGNVILRSEPKETRVFTRPDGTEELCVLEEAITTDFALIRAHKADRDGNLVFRLTAQNMNPSAAMCGKITVVEVEELVETGELRPEEIHLQGIFVDRILVLTPEQAADKVAERIITRSEDPDDNEPHEALVAKNEHGQPIGWTRAGIAARAAKELKDGSYVNLGVGIPTSIPDYLPEDVQVVFQSENGLLKFGPFPLPDEVDADLINASKQTTTLAPGGSTFDSVRSFDMIRGKHVNTAVLGALQVSEKGDIANWGIPGRKTNGMGGAMDLVKGAQRVIAIMEHLNVHGEHRILKECTYPLTAAGAISLVITNLGVFQVADHGLVLTELAPGITVEDIREYTEPEVHVALDLHN
ncbi:3-oxoacid CoA-transferase subunit B [Luteococcus sp. H138]|uniref:3-oxoacid CoA-transferase n=1 Tax=unclassified Luteococcus TaxID=2639923 RepID=UPI00313F2110